MKLLRAVALLLLLASARLYGAFAAVQTSAQVTGAGSTFNFTLSATGTGNLVILYLATPDGISVTGVSDTAGNTYDFSTVYASSPNNLTIAYGVQVTGGVTTVTATFSAAGTGKRALAEEFSGGASTNATVFEVSGRGSGTGTTLSVSSISVTSGDLIVACVRKTTGTDIVSAGTGYTAFNTGNTNLYTQYKLSSGTTETAPASMTGTGVAWLEVAMAFKPAGAPTSTPTPTVTPTATPSINADAYDYYSITALAVDITSITITGTPTDGQTLWISIVGTATRAITLGSQFEPSTQALPTTTVGTDRLDIGCIWDIVTSKCRVVAVS